MRFFALFLGVFLLSACGNQSTKQLLAKSPTPSPSPTAPSPSPSPSPSPVTPSGLKWTEAEITSASDRCAQKGDASYSVSQWRSFCDCSYRAAAQRWTQEDFYALFEERFQTLSEEGIIEACMRKAGIEVQS
jgi:hypothetical protein